MKQVELHLAALAAAGVGVGLTGDQAKAVVVYSGVANLSVPATVGGLYVNMVTHITGGDGDLTPGWDFNPWVSGGSTWKLWGFGSHSLGGVMVGDLPTHLTVIGPTSTWQTFSADIPTGNDIIMGIRFLNEHTSSIHYGWVAFNNPASPAVAPITIIDWAYQTVAGASIFAGEGGRVFPSPGAASALLLGVGAAGARRRRA